MEQTLNRRNFSAALMLLPFIDRLTPSPPINPQIPHPNPPNQNYVLEPGQFTAYGVNAFRSVDQVLYRFGANRMLANTENPDYRITQPHITSELMEVRTLSEIEQITLKDGSPFITNPKQLKKWKNRHPNPLPIIQKTLNPDLEIPHLIAPNADDLSTDILDEQFACRPAQIIAPEYYNHEGELVERTTAGTFEAVIIDLQDPRHKGNGHFCDLSYHSYLPILGLQVNQNRPYYTSQTQTQVNYIPHTKVMVPYFQV